MPTCVHTDKEWLYDNIERKWEDSSMNTAKDLNTGNHLCHSNKEGLHRKIIVENGERG